jgi:putative NIF3 family GTP cyclohydrolase 1 type 2
MWVSACLPDDPKPWCRKKQHQALAMTQAGSHIILCNHTNTERGYLTAVLKEKLEKELNMEQDSGKWEVIVSRVDKDPLRVV